MIATKYRRKSISTNFNIGDGEGHDLDVSHKQHLSGRGVGDRMANKWT